MPAASHDIVDYAARRCSAPLPMPPPSIRHDAPRLFSSRARHAAARYALTSFCQRLPIEPRSFAMFALPKMIAPAAPMPPAATRCATRHVVCHA